MTFTSWIQNLPSMIIADCLIGTFVSTAFHTSFIKTNFLGDYNTCFIFAHSYNHFLCTDKMVYVSQMTII